MMTVQISDEERRILLLLLDLEWQSEDHRAKRDLSYMRALETLQGKLKS